MLRELRLRIMGAPLPMFGAMLATDAFPTNSISGVNQTPVAPPIPAPREFPIEPQAELAQAGVGSLTTLTDGATIDLNCNNGLGSLFQVTLGGNRTFNTFHYPAPGQQITLIVTQDGTGSRLITWPSNVIWSAATAPTLTTTAGQSDMLTFLFDASANGGAGQWLGQLPATAKNFLIA